LYSHSIWWRRSLYTAAQYTGSPLLTGVLCSRVQTATLPDAVRIQFVLLKMGMLMLETCRG